MKSARKKKKIYVSINASASNIKNFSYWLEIQLFLQRAENKQFNMEPVKM